MKQRLGEFEPRQVWATRGSSEEIIRVGQNTKVSALANRIMERFLARGTVEMETASAGAVNQAVKAVARARQALESEGYALVIIPELVQVPLGHGNQIVTHLTVVDMHGDSMNNDWQLKITG